MLFKRALAWKRSLFWRPWVVTATSYVVQQIMFLLCWWTDCCLGFVSPAFPCVFHAAILSGLLCTRRLGLSFFWLGALSISVLYAATWGTPLWLVIVSLALCKASCDLYHAFFPLIAPWVVSALTLIVLCLLASILSGNTILLGLRNSIIVFLLMIPISWGMTRALSWITPWIKSS